MNGQKLSSKQRYDDSYKGFIRRIIRPLWTKNQMSIEVLLLT